MLLFYLNYYFSAYQYYYLYIQLLVCNCLLMEQGCIALWYSKFILKNFSFCPFKFERKIVIVQDFLYSSPTPPVKVKPPSSSNTPTYSAPSHWKFPATNHYHLNSDETNQTNIVVRRVVVLGILHWYKCQ